MPIYQDTNCPFCGALFAVDDAACPSCDLPLLNPDATDPPRRPRSPFDGAELFDDAFAGDEFDLDRGESYPLKTERRSSGNRMRCVVVAMNQAEAEMLESVLRAEEVPCMLRMLGPRPYTMSGSRCEVLVPEFALPFARELLRVEDSPEVATGPSPLVLAGGIVAGLIVLAAMVALIALIV